ncbi:MAG: DUF3168 domain-containing protein, partial [Kiritimatiellae bacterium]|nr:DUF3168 domain-containing protein [Kiritimatiellia bacterium]
MNDTLAKALYAELVANTGLAAIFGARVYRRGWVPQGPTAPYLVYFQVSSQHLRDVDGGIGQ